MRPVCSHQRNSDTSPHCKRVVRRRLWIWRRRRHVWRRIGTATVAARLARGGEGARVRRKASGDMRSGRRPFCLDMLLTLTARLRRFRGCWCLGASQASLTSTEPFSPPVSGSLYPQLHAILSVLIYNPSPSSPLAAGGAQTHRPNASVNSYSPNALFAFYLFQVKQSWQMSAVLSASESRSADTVEQFGMLA